MKGGMVRMRSRCSPLLLRRWHATRGTRLHSEPCGQIVTITTTTKRSHQHDEQYEHLHTPAPLFTPHSSGKHAVEKTRNRDLPTCSRMMVSCSCGEQPGWRGGAHTVATVHAGRHEVSFVVRVQPKRCLPHTATHGRWATAAAAAAAERRRSMGAVVASGCKRERACSKRR